MGSAYDIGADWDAGYVHPGVFRIAGSLDSMSAVEAIRAIQEEVARIRSTEVTDAELKAAKDAALNALAFAFDTKTKALNRMLDYEYYGYPKDFIQQFQKALAAATTADVLRVAKQHLDPASFAIVTVGNPTEFLSSPDSLGAVHQVDLTIPSAEAAPVDAAGLAKGKQMLERAQQAVGGAAALAAIQDFTQTSDVQVDPSAGGALLHVTDRWLAPGTFRRDQDGTTGKTSVYLSGRSGWVSPPQTTAPLTGARLKEMLGHQFRLFFRLLLADRAAGWTVNAVDDGIVEITDGAGQIAQVLVDPATGMPRSVRYDAPLSNGAPASVEDAWSDFRETAGVKLPYKIAMVSNGKKYADVTVTGCKLNSGLKPEDMRKRP
jgi:hypothetical protein